MRQNTHKAAAGASFTAEEARALGNTTWFKRQDDGIFLFRVGKVFTLEDLLLWGADRGFSTFEVTTATGTRQPLAPEGSWRRKL